MSHPDVVVAGGGVVGLSAAWRVAQAGLNVVVVDERPGHGASWVAAGMLAPVTELHYGEEALLRLNLSSAELYPGFVAELEDATGADVGYRRSGTLVVARDRDDLAAVDELFDFQRGLGLDVERLGARDCRGLEPVLAPSIRGGLLVTNDHSVDPRALCRALVVACERAGVRFATGRVAEVLSTGDEVTGARTISGDVVACRWVIAATGTGTGTVGGLPPELAHAIRPVKGQLLILRDPSGTSIPGRNVRGLEVYLVPRDEGYLVVGATVEERGYDTTVTAGAVLELLRRAYEIIPGVVELELVETLAGLRPASADNGPVIGTTGIDGLIAATGHYRNGILLAPITAETIAAVVRGRPIPPAAQPFSPRRFAPAEVAP